MTAWEGLTPPYSTIVADPPWSYGTSRIITTAKSAATSPSVSDRYGTMTAEEVAALPVADLAAPDAHLYLWVTNPLLPDAFQVVAGWGFRYITCLTWLKTGTLGLGYYWRGDTEHVLFGVRGRLPIPIAAATGSRLTRAGTRSSRRRSSTPWSRSAQARESSCSPAPPVSAGTPGATATRWERRHDLRLPPRCSEGRDASQPAFGVPSLRPVR